MPVFSKDDRNVLYIHVPKTGGSTIESIFLRSGYDHFLLRTKHSVLFRVLRASPQHYHAALLEAVLDLSRFNYIFMTVRHPLRRIESEFHMRNGKGDQEINGWILHALESYEKNPFLYDNHIRPQAEFRVESAEVWRQETGYDADWVAAISNRIGDRLTAKVVNRLVAPETRSEISPEVRREVERFYQVDYDMFGY